jgi:flagellar basal-body rod protein FlgG
MASIALNSSSSGLSALSTALDVIANNLANVNTDGYKASRANFQDLFYQELAQPGAENANGDQHPTGLFVGLGVQVSGTQLNFEQGPAINTNMPLDIMIEGDGFFQIEIGDDIGEGIGYTRAGNFVRNSDGEMVLGTNQGRRLIPTIEIPADATSVTIKTDGTVQVTLPGSTDPVDLETIQLATFINPSGLQQIGENTYIPSAASGEALIGDPLEDGRGGLRQGFLEGSNVDPVTELVNLIRTQRAFELNSQCIKAADESLQIISQLGRF